MASEEHQRYQASTHIAAVSALFTGKSVASCFEYSDTKPVL